MNRYIENLKVFLEQQAPNYGYDDASSLLEMLCYYYTVNNPVDNAVIRCQFMELGKIIGKMPIWEADAVFDVTGALCAAYERQAFKDGILVGMRLFLELDIPGLDTGN